MTFNAETPRGAMVSPRVALISIICFWMVYCVIATIRSFMIDLGHQADMLAARAFVSIGSMVATYIVYLAMRPLARKSLAVNVTAVALLSIPAAVAYSSMNWMAFREIDRRIEADKANTASKVTVETDGAAQARAQAKAAIEAARAAMREVAEQAREAAQEKADAQREAVERQAEIQRELAEAQSELARANAERRRQADEGKREAEQALREAALAQREAYREAVRDYREQMQEARQAVQEARRQGIKIDIDSILAAVPPPRLQSRPRLQKPPRRPRRRLRRPPRRCPRSRSPNRWKFRCR